MTTDSQTPRRRLRLLLLLSAVAVLCVAALGTAGCGDDDEEPPAAPPDSSASALPAEVREAGEVRVASDVSYPPLEYFEADGKTVTGFDHDLGQALGKRLGVRFRFVNTGFDGIIPALQAGRFDVVMSAMTDNKERQRVLDFVDYLNAGTSILVKKGNPKGIEDLDSLCGTTVAVQRGTIHFDRAKSVAEKCKGDGSPPAEVKVFPKDTDAIMQVRSGRADADLTDSPVAAYSARQSKDLEVVDAPVYGAEPYGIGLKKGNDQLRDAIRDALQELIEDGTYRRLLDKYGMASGAVEEATINAGDG